MADRAATGEPFELEQFLPFRMQRLAALLTADFFASAGRRGGLGWTEWYILSALARTSHQTATDINIRSGLGKTAISRAVALLEESGYILRQRDHSDRRVERLVISPEGMEMQALLGRSAEAYAERLLALCGANDHAGMARLLGIIEENLIASRSVG